MTNAVELCEEHLAGDVVDGIGGGGKASRQLNGGCCCGGVIATGAKVDTNPEIGWPEVAEARLPEAGFAVESYSFDKGNSPSSSKTEGVGEAQVLSVIAATWLPEAGEGEFCEPSDMGEPGGVTATSERISRSGESIGGGEGDKVMDFERDRRRSSAGLRDGSREEDDDAGEKPCLLGLEDSLPRRFSFCFMCRGFFGLAERRPVDEAFASSVGDLAFEDLTIEELSGDRWRLVNREDGLRV